MLLVRRSENDIHYTHASRAELYDQGNLLDQRLHIQPWFLVLYQPANCILLGSFCLAL